MRKISRDINRDFRRSNLNILFQDFHYLITFNDDILKILFFILNQTFLSTLVIKVNCFQKHKLQLLMILRILQCNISLMLETIISQRRAKHLFY